MMDFQTIKWKLVKLSPWGDSSRGIDFEYPTEAVVLKSIKIKSFGTISSVSCKMNSN